MWLAAAAAAAIIASLCNSVREKQRETETEIKHTLSGARINRLDVKGRVSLACGIAKAVRAAAAAAGAVEAA